ncbi:Pyrroline-5-carboxylate reductase [Caballeronia calidae]|uniref:Pyrroline-5-carboxylate reductase n=1 Tax=Caballeronia calidae TaxID=1777139 RepID=A0A158B8Q3_9BURK|nr:NAD(P)-binding domain-containing protein [Caballeronia calidae]SAK66462.1 Pyrroline-5-carboxylate reductase [Caballeronia calidae]
MKLGVLGVGDLTEKMVRGLYRSKSGIELLLAPRNRERAEALAKDVGCTLLASNQDVVDTADVVLIGVRPSQVAELAAQVSFKPYQALVSVVTGVPVSELKKLFGTENCSRAMLSAASEINRSTVAVYPPDSPAETLLSSLGNVVSLNTEVHFELATVGACMNGWFYFLFHELEQWFVKKGLTAQQARELAFSSVEDCVAYSRHKQPTELREIGAAIALPGTYTAQGLEVLNGLGANAAWKTASEAVFELLTEKEPG